MKINKVPILLKAKKSYFNKVLALAPIAYWPMNELSGTAAINYGTLGAGANGVYSGATLAQVAAPGSIGGLAPLFDGNDDLCNVYSAALNGGFNGNLLTFAIWWKVSAAGDWTDGTNRDVVSFYIDANNYIEMNKGTVNNTFRILMRSGAVQKNIDSTAYANTDWNLLVWTNTDAGDEQKWYMNGLQLGTTQTGIGTWAGNLAAASTALGNSGTGVAKDWKGYLAHAAIWDRILTSTELALLYTGAGF